MVCTYCGYNMGNGLRLCPKCSKMTGYREKEVEQSMRSMQSAQSKRNHLESNKGYSDEEILALGLYPKGEGYKMSLISRILGRK